jgi:hypothetical protein
VTAPLSGRRCVAYSLEVWHRVEGQNADQTRLAWRRVRPGLAGISDDSGTVLIAERLLGRSLVWMEPGAYDPFTVVSDTQPRPEERMSPGQPDRPGLDQLIAAGLVPDSRRLRRWPPYWVKERVLEAGTPLTVIGRPVKRDGEVMLDLIWPGPCGVATATPEQVREHFAAVVRDMTFARRFLAAVGALIVVMLVASIFASSH